MKLIRYSLACVLALGVPAHLPASPNAKKSGNMEKGCESLGEVRLCLGLNKDIPLEMSLFIGSKRSDAMTGVGDENLPYEMERRNGVYRVKVGNPSTATVEFFYFDEISFRKVGSRYLATTAVIASSHECDGRPDLRRVDRIDFGRRTITTILEPAWTANEKGWRFSHPINPKTSDIHELSFGYLAEFLAETPATQRLCDIYG